MEILLILSLLLNLGAVIGVILLHLRQTRFERSVTFYVRGAVETAGAEIAAIKGMMLKAAAGALIGVILAKMMNGDDNGGPDNV